MDEDGRPARRCEFEQFLAVLIQSVAVLLRVELQARTLVALQHCVGLLERARVDRIHDAPLQQLIALFNDLEAFLVGKLSRLRPSSAHCWVLFLCFRWKIHVSNNFTFSLYYENCGLNVC